MYIYIYIYIYSSNGRCHAKCAAHRLVAQPELTMVIPAAGILFKWRGFEAISLCDYPFLWDFTPHESRCSGQRSGVRLHGKAPKTLELQLPRIGTCKPVRFRRSDCRPAGPNRLCRNQALCVKTPELCMKRAKALTDVTEQIRPQSAVHERICFSKFRSTIYSRRRLVPLRNKLRSHPLRAPVGRSGRHKAPGACPEEDK